ncbi:rubber dioxygenase RoxB [Isoalcanivorax indicus]|uniref:rubber dioxygenase RoxB n=1 Tax=Isoalcanivorax indicus TaxID=2202653 RepID=UPI001FE74CA6|nr:hypothetical protein [Isoalcanivorax indicus]
MLRYLIALGLACASMLAYAQPYSDIPSYDGDDDLLGSFHGGSRLWAFCQQDALPDSTPLPTDPRMLLQPGVNDGLAVHFNTFWKDCHVDPVAVQERGQPETCGELRERVQAGRELLRTGGEKVGALFAGTKPMSLESGFGISTFTASQYNQLWRIWGGFMLRPDNFDELVAQRYGSGFKQARNPYPLPFEDPNRTDGGSGQLPEMFTQLRDDDGSWTGRIGITCHACHSGVIGTPEDGEGLGLTFGSGSSLADLNLFLRDMLPLGYPASAATLLNLNRTRGTNNASLINMAFLFPDQGYLTPSEVLGLVTSGSTAGMDTPAWWNMGHRPAKFVDGVFPMDAPRVDMVFYTPFAGLFGSIGGPVSEAGKRWMREHGPDLNSYVETLKSPPYPFDVDEQLAHEGAELFHTLDMWSEERQNTLPRPEGNGSCASCHGAYSRRYTQDPGFLESPDMEGLAGYIVPLDIIGTSPVRAMTNNEAVQTAGAKNFFGYPPTFGTDQDCGPQNREALRGDRELGYLAPPLYGIWATAPYLHNGSVPDLWSLLKPEDRPPLWRRVSTPPRSDQRHRVVMGFDTDLQRAFDQDRVGWRYDAIECRRRTWWSPTISPYINCDPRDDHQDPLFQRVVAGLYSNLALAWNILFPPILTNEQMEERKIYNTHMYGQSNHGHEFNSVLSDNERLAIIEYLKTL